MRDADVTTKILLATIKERLEEAIADGDHCAARETFLEMLQIGKTWLLRFGSRRAFRKPIERSALQKPWRRSS